MDAIHAFRLDPSLRAKLGAKGRKAYEELYSENVHLDRYLELANSILEAKTGNRRNSA